MSLDPLDIVTTLLGLLYILLEYRASVLLWVVGFVMPLLDIWLYYRHGLYADSLIAVYYALAALYGYAAWMWGRHRCQAESKSRPITHFPIHSILPSLLFFLAAWAGLYWILSNYTSSTVPVTDSFANALSFVGLWALAKKYLEQWLVWIVVDLVLSILYASKGLPFKAGLYGLYVAIAVAGYFKWKRLMHESLSSH